MTDAEASPDGRTVVARTPHVASLHRASDILAGRMQAYATIALDDLCESQGEGVALQGDVLHLSSEAGPFSRGGSLLGLNCRLPSP